jgi:prepilin-type N-terminal cleavage/methylation domain-containing protein
MPRTGRAGFTLIEVLVAMAVALVLILGTAELITYSLKAKKKGDLASGLAHVATARLESLKSVPFASGGLEPGVYSAVVQDELSLEMFGLTWTIDEEEDGMEKVVLAARSLDYPRSEIRLLLYISRALEFQP